jgi:AraC-like DNA-binding protein
MNSTVTIGYLSKEIGVKLNYLSQIINELLNKNFYEFINDYRINAAIEMMSNQKYKKKSIENILYEVGYNSRSTFFTIFKAKTGMTPKIFRKKLSS